MKFSSLQAITITVHLWKTIRVLFSPDDLRCATHVLMSEKVEEWTKWWSGPLVKLRLNAQIVSTGIDFTVSI